ncbi:DUF2835 domain-containing protein [Pontibacterium sp.]|uniref:DUF2835 domain-containing protein n=1 Tax=Pontibacterium sp. TaxID=2036026 RepID=UPI003512B67A
MNKIIFDIHLPADEYLRVYKGSARDVVTRALDGRTVRFPANILQPYLLHAGIFGRFCITFDRSGRFQKIEKLS